MKRLVYTFLTVILLLGLTACGGKKDTTGTDESVPATEREENPSAASEESGEQGIAGYYKVNSMEAEGETIDLPMLEMLGMADTIYLVLESDGTGRMCFEEEAEITYDEIRLYAGGEGAPYTLDGDTLTLEIEGVKLVFVRSDETPPQPGSVPVQGAFPESFGEAYGGDWHGMLEIYEGTGGFEDNVGEQVEIIARFAFHEDGSCTPFIAAALSSDSGSNFSNLSVTYNEYGDLMILEGEFIDDPITDNSNIYIMDDVLRMDIYVDNGSGDSMNIIASLRRLDDTWDYDYDYPTLPEATVEFYQGKNMEEIAELFGLDPSVLPEVSSGSTNAGSASGSPGFSEPTAEYDYEEKGMIIFDYPSDSYTFEKKFGVDTLKSNDGTLKITFVASWDMEEYGRVMEGYEKYAEESSGVIEDGLSYGGHEAVRCTWENVIGDVTMETYILFNDSYGDYVGINVIAAAPSQSALDANRDVIEAILHSVRPR